MSYTKKEKEQINAAVERHRLFLLAKYHYARFEKIVGKANVESKLAEINQFAKQDAKVCKLFWKAGGEWNLPINNDAWLYAKSDAVKPAHRVMKWHLLWALLTNLLLLCLAIYLCAAPWIQGSPVAQVDSNTLQSVIIYMVLIILSCLWVTNRIKRIFGNARRVLGWQICWATLSLKDHLFNILAPLLLIGVASALASTPLEQVAPFCSLSASIIAFVCSMFILDCILGLSPRRYFFCIESFFEFIKTLLTFYKNFSIYEIFQQPFEACKLSLRSSYYHPPTYEDYYHSKAKGSLEIEMKKNPFIFSNRSGELEFQPSSSWKFIIQYAVVDVIHTICILAFMFAVNHAVLHVKPGIALLVAAFYLAFMCLFLNRPLEDTNNFHWYICKNLYANKVSHLFRKLFFSLLLIAGTILCLNIA